MAYFPYGDTEIQHLKKKDKKLSAAIDQIGMISREIHPALFPALLDSIFAQQISGKAAATIWNRFCELVGEVTPEKVNGLSVESIQQCGTSFRKAGYVKGIAEAAASGEINFDTLNNLSDEEIIQTLTRLKGVGRWTVEMLLLFSLCRPDIVSYDDLAIRRGMMKLYNLKELPKEKFLTYKKRYTPYGSVASLYLWAVSTWE